MSETAYLILQNGRVFSGRRCGAPGDTVAETVFTTGMTGYLETLTDPSYHGQIVVQTFPSIGNYGLIPEDFESDGPRLSAYIMRELCDTPSNFRSQGPLDDWLKARGVIGLQGVDTRGLTQELRERGIMNGAVVSKLPADLTAFCADLEHRELAANVYQVTNSKPRVLGGLGRSVVLWNFGYKAALAAQLLQRGNRVTLMPANSTAEEILALHPDGVLLSNGPGDPATYKDIIAEVRKLFGARLPMMGVCLGHQLMALALGAASHKLPYGHRGANQPVIDMQSGRLYITSQNHGYAIKTDNLPAGLLPRFENLNDHSCEGLDYLDRPAFSVQFHPEACGGPLDTGFLFKRFMQIIDEA